MTFLCIYCNTVYFPLFHANTRGGSRLRDTICATYTVAAVSAFFDCRRRQSRHLLNYPRLRFLRCLRCLLLLVGPWFSCKCTVAATDYWVKRYDKICVVYVMCKCTLYFKNQVYKVWARPYSSAAEWRVRQRISATQTQLNAKNGRRRNAPLYPYL